MERIKWIFIYSIYLIYTQITCQILSRLVEKI